MIKGKGAMKNKNKQVNNKFERENLKISLKIQTMEIQQT